MSTHDRKRRHRAPKPQPSFHEWEEPSKEDWQLMFRVMREGMRLAEKLPPDVDFNELCRTAAGNLGICLFIQRSGPYDGMLATRMEIGG